MPRPALLRHFAAELMQAQPHQGGAFRGVLTGEHLPSPGSVSLANACKHSLTGPRNHGIDGVFECGCTHKSTHKENGRKARRSRTSLCFFFFVFRSWVRGIPPTTRRGRGGGPSESIKVPYWFHQNNDDSKCEV